MRFGTILAMLVWMADGTAVPVEPASRVLEFARSKLGEIVGDGECSSLVIAALEHAGVEIRRGSSPYGEPLEGLDDLRPGDVLQFEDVRFAGRQVRPNRTISTWEYHFPQHLAIVSGVTVRGRNRLLRLIHQNARIQGRDESGAVKEWTIPMTSYRSGVIRAFRPVPPVSKPGSDQSDPGPRTH